MCLGLKQHMNTNGECIQSTKYESWSLTPRQSVSAGAKAHSTNRV